MASREHEIMFRMNAQLNGGFSATLSRAQAEFVKLGQQIREVHQAQRDVSSYEKLQKAADNTSARLINLKRQSELLTREIDEAKSKTGEEAVSTTALEREQAKLEESIRRTQTALEGQNQRLDDAGERLRQAGVDVNDLSGAGALLSARLTELQERQREAAESAQDMGTGLENAGAGAEAMAAALTSAGAVGAVRELTAAFMDCVGASGDFEAAMSAVEAISSATGREMDALNEKARDLGASTVYTAQESAGAMEYMAMAGWDAQEMLSGMDSVIQLAAASGEDLGQVSDIVTDNLTAFGLEARDTGHFADVLAAAATNSNTSIGFMGDTFKNAASVAGALGYTIEDVAVATGLMANAGVKGSRAGTALRNIFNGLLDGVTLTSAAFGEYEYSAVRADGTMKSFSETLRDLRGYFDQMSEAERVSNARVIAGERGYNGLLAILNATSEQYDSLTADIENCAGAAERMSRIKLDNLNGQLTLMKSAWEGLKLAVGDQFNPVLRGAYKVLTDVINEVSSFVKAHPATVKAVAAFTGVVGGATVALTGYAAAVKVIKALDLASTFASGGPLIVGLGLTAAAVAGLTEALGRGRDEYEKMTVAARSFEDEADAARRSYEDEIARVDAASAVVGGYIDRLDELNAAETLTDAQRREYQATVELLKEAMPELADSIETTTGGIVTNTDALRENADAILENARNAAYSQYLTTYMEKYSDVVSEAVDNRIELQKAQNKEKELRQELEPMEKRRGELLAKYNDLTSDEDRELELLNTKIQDYNIKIEEQQDAQQGANDAIAKGEAVLAEAKAGYEEVQKAIDDLTGGMGLAGDAAGGLSGAQDDLQGRLESFVAELKAADTAYQELYDAAYESVSGQYGLWDEAAERIPTDIDAINKAQSSQRDYWRDYYDDLQTLSDAAGEIEGLGELLASFADGSADSVNAVAGIAEAFKAGDIQKIRDTVKAWQDLREEQKLVSGALAKLKRGAGEDLEEIGQEFLDWVEDLDLSGEAARSADRTIRAYIDKVQDLTPEVKAAYDAMLQGLTSALTGPVPHGYRQDPSFLDGGYASGTDYAQPGAKLVGEEGPEIVYFRGGERVLNARDTSAVLTGGGGSYTVTVSPVYNITGGMDAGELRRVLEEHNRELESMVEETVERVEAERREDALRRGYI